MMTVRWQPDMILATQHTAGYDAELSRGMPSVCIPDSKASPVSSHSEGGKEAMMRQKEVS